MTPFHSYSDEEESLIKYHLENKFNLDNGIYKCKFVCKKPFKYPCELWYHLYKGREEHWNNPDKDRSFCGMDQSNERNELDMNKYQRIKVKVSKSEAIVWVVEQVKERITKMCCCHEENGLFCHLVDAEFHNNGPLTSTIFQGIVYYGDHLYTEECCRKCKYEDIELPVYINGQPGIYVKLPQNIFRFGQVFKSFVKITDFKKHNTVNNSEEDNQSHKTAQGSDETSATDNRKDKKISYDYNALYETAKLATKNLDEVIDINFYPTNKTKKSNSKHRPIGLGIQGLADVFFKLGIAYDSEKAKEINKQIFETIYFGALEASCELAKEKGSYETFENSPISQGKFQFDLWGVKPSSKWDWETLKSKIKKYGVRNSLTTACMPTASTGIILGNTETFQIQTSNIYKRQTLSGEFLLVNRYLVKELSKRNLWNKDMRDKIILENGSVENVSEIPKELKEVYKTVWEVSQKTVIDMAADRAPFIDQTQSMNLWLSTPTFGKVNSMHMYAWKKGLKTGMYYLRSRSAVDAVKVTVSAEKAAKDAYISTTIKQNNEPEDCETCSA